MRTLEEGICLCGGRRVGSGGIGGTGGGTDSLVGGSVRGGSWNGGAGKQCDNTRRRVRRLSTMTMLMRIGMRMSAREEATGGELGGVKAMMV